MRATTSGSASPRPFYGAFLFGYAAALTVWVKHGLRALSYRDLFVLMPLWAVLAALRCAWLVIPTGYLAQRLMRWAAGEAPEAEGG